MLRQSLTIARATGREAIRQPLYLAVLGGLILLLALNLFLSSFALGDEGKLLLDLGLSTIFLGGMLLAAFTATGVLAREIEDQTVQVVLSKPVSRPAFVLGKYVGVAAAVAVAFWIAGLVFLLTVRHQVRLTVQAPYDWPVIVLGGGGVLVALLVALWGNYFYRWNFTSRLVALLALTMPLAYLLVLMLDRSWQLQPLSTEFTASHDHAAHVGHLAAGAPLVQVLWALLLVLEGILVMAAVAVACATRLGQVMTLVVCASVFLVGLSSDYLFGRFASHSVVAWLGHVVTPNLQYLWVVDALTQEREVSAAYVSSVSLYSTLHVVAWLALAVALFQRRETR
jgi:ABC-2 type transport system permease protein